MAGGALRTGTMLGKATRHPPATDRFDLLSKRSQKSMQRPRRSQSPKRVGSGRWGPPISGTSWASGGRAPSGSCTGGSGDRSSACTTDVSPMVLGGCTRLSLPAPSSSPQNAGALVYHPVSILPGTAECKVPVCPGLSVALCGRASRCASPGDSRQEVRPCVNRPCVITSPCGAWPPCARRSR